MAAPDPRFDRGGLPICSLADLSVVLLALGSTRLSILRARLAGAEVPRLRDRPPRGERLRRLVALQVRARGSRAPGIDRALPDPLASCVRARERPLSKAGAPLPPALVAGVEAARSLSSFHSSGMARAAEPEPLSAMRWHVPAGLGPHEQGGGPRG